MVTKFIVDLQSPENKTTMSSMVYKDINVDPKNVTQFIVAYVKM